MSKFKFNRMQAFLHSDVWIEDLRPLIEDLRDGMLRKALRTKDNLTKRSAFLEAYGAFDILLKHIQDHAIPGLPAGEEE